ncbi:MAG: glycoside hydrolase family 31 protein, partial [Acidimicrobiales bacterium]
MPVDDSSGDPGRTGSRSLVRSVDRVSRGDGFVDLSVSAVRCRELGVAPGIVTDEPPGTQGLRRHAPHIPELMEPELEPRQATIRVRMAAPDIVRVTVDADRTSFPGDDDLRDGILVDAQPGDAHFRLSERDGAGGREDRELWMATPALSFVVNLEPFAFRLVDENGAILVRSGGERRQAMGAPLAAALSFDERTISVGLELRPRDDILGLGEQAGPPLRNGQRLTVTVDDALGTGTGRTYKAAPILHSRLGYSVFVHTPGPVAADVGATYPALLVLDTEDVRFDMFLIAGGGLRHRLERYTALTGRMRVPPRWAFGAWMSRSRYRDRDELLDAAVGMRAHDLPCDVMHLDPSWLERDLLSCDFVWSEERFPDPAGLIAELRRLGFRLSLWELSYLDPASPIAAQARQSGYLVLDEDGEPAAVARTFSRDGRPRWLVDFSKPEARSWWKSLHSDLLELGVEVFKTDFGEGLPDNARLANGRKGRSWRNLYPLWYNRCVSEAISEHTGRAGLVWGRSGWAGSQRYPAQWAGDAESSIAGMAATIRAGIAWQLSAPGLWSHDIGGFYGGGSNGVPSPELYVRWAQFGCLSPLTRFHGLTPREPWEFGPDALAIVRAFLRLRYQLLPYLVSAAWECARTGVPIMRPLCLDYETDSGSWHAPHQYLLGGDLLVAPVLDESPDEVTVDVVVPPGEWIDFFTGAVHSGP